MKMVLFALMLCGLFTLPAHAQYQVVGSCGAQSLNTGDGVMPYVDQSGRICDSGGSGTTTYQGTITLSAATSTTLTSGNVTMASSTVLPSAFQRLVMINVGASSGYVCWFGGSASASSGCELIAAGASDTVWLNKFATPPTLFSTSGTTFAFRN